MRLPLPQPGKGEDTVNCTISGEKAGMEGLTESSREISNSLGSVFHICFGFVLLACGTRVIEAKLSE